MNLSSPSNILRYMIEQHSPPSFIDMMNDLDPESAVRYPNGVIAGWVFLCKAQRETLTQPQRGGDACPDDIDKGLPWHITPDDAFRKGLPHHTRTHEDAVKALLS